MRSMTRILAKEQRKGRIDLSDWRVMGVLPNIQLLKSIDSEWIALAPYKDDRVRRLCREQPKLRQFLNSFTDAFKVKVHPAAILLRADAPDALRNVSAIASFRDAVAISVVPYCRALRMVNQQTHRVGFSNAFWIHPWMLGRSGEDLFTSTPGLLAVHDVAAFRGQTTPEISHMPLSRSDIDLPLLSELLKRWERSYMSRRPKWKDRALFRSLNMAFQASQLPGGIDSTYLDVGRIVALWVRACEILVHPGGKGRSDLFKVYDSLAQAEWLLGHARKRRYKAYKRSGRQVLACWIYGRMYQVRNDFLHGNKIDSRKLMIMPASLPLFQFPAPVYRMLLASVLPLRFRLKKLSVKRPDEFGSEIARQSDFRGFQRTMEQAILMSRGFSPSVSRRTGRAVTSRPRRAPQTDEE